MDNMRIEIFGEESAESKKLEKLVGQALKELNVKGDLIMVEDIIKIAAGGVMITPAMAVDGEVMFEGRVPTLDEIKDIFRKEQKMA